MDTCWPPSCIEQHGGRCQETGSWRGAWMKKMRELLLESQPEVRDVCPRRYVVDRAPRDVPEFLLEAERDVVQVNVQREVFRAIRVALSPLNACVPDMREPGQLERVHV